MTKNEVDKIAIGAILDFIGCLLFELEKHSDTETKDLITPFFVNSYESFAQVRGIDLKDISIKDIEWYKKYNKEFKEAKKEPKEATIDSLCAGAVLDFARLVGELSARENPVSEKLSVLKGVFDIAILFLKNKNIKEKYLDEPEYRWNMFCETGDYQLKVPISNQTLQ